MKNKERLINLKNELKPIFKEHFKDIKIRIDDYTIFEEPHFIEIVIDEEDEITIINPSKLQYVVSHLGSKFLHFRNNEENKICTTTITLICPTPKVANNIAKSFQLYLANREIEE